MTLVVNFFGGPAIGKSTQAAGLFNLMKRAQLSVEMPYEFPKIVAWEENYSAIKDQFYITANQHRNITRLHGKVDYIIVDSPIILGIVYKERYSTEPEYPSMFYDYKFDDFIFSLFKKYKSLNIVLKRDDSTYDHTGRFQNLEESKQIDEDIVKKLAFNGIPYVEFQVNETTTENIFNYIKNNYLGNLK